MTAPHKPNPDRSDGPGPHPPPQTAVPREQAEVAAPAGWTEPAGHIATAEGLAAASAGLDGLDGLPIGEHVARYEAVHAALQDALTSIDSV